MHRLQDQRLLEAWDRGGACQENERALALLAAACPEYGEKELATLSVHQLTLQLIRLHRITFGSLLEGWLPCPECGTRLEFAMPLRPIEERLELPEPEELLHWERNGRSFSLRPVNS